MFAKIASLVGSWYIAEQPHRTLRAEARDRPAAVSLAEAQLSFVVRCADEVSTRKHY
jgi:hypothetical protein